MSRRRKPRTAGKGWHILRLRGAVTFLKELGLTGLACSVEESGVKVINSRFSGATQIASTEKS